MNSVHTGIANEILAQLGNRAMVMMGARDVVAGASFVQFRIAANAKRINKIKIELDASDTYTIEFWNIRGMNAKKIAERSDVYVDAMHKVIEHETGLYLSL